MGHKVHPNAFRLGVFRPWEANWFANPKDYTKMLHEDLEMRRVILARLRNAGIAKIETERSSNAQLTVTTPAANVSGTVDVTVTTPGGTSAITQPADQFTYLGPPVVTGVSPASGNAAGGDTVTITGTGFTGATAVDFGTTAGTSVTVVNATTITALSPAGTGIANVTVITPNGTSPAT